MTGRKVTLYEMNISFNITITAFSRCRTDISSKKAFLFSYILNNRECFFKYLVSQFSCCFKGCQFTVFQFFLAFVFEQQLNKTWFPTFFTVAFEDTQYIRIIPINVRNCADVINYLAYRYRMSYCLNESTFKQVNRFLGCFLD